jgi:osteoglycin (osteoinductive factor mimecan)
LIEDIEDGTFSKLSLLEELILAENQLLKLPVLPPKLTVFNAKYNKIKSRGIKANTFKVSVSKHQKKKKKKVDSLVIQLVI